MQRFLILKFTKFCFADYKYSCMKESSALRKVNFAIDQYDWRQKWRIKVMEKFLILSLTKISLKVDNTNEN
jgi:hypothetical protein